MPRTIHELIAAMFAGEPFTQADVDRVFRHNRQLERRDATVWPSVNPPDADEPIGTGLREFRAITVRNMRTFTTQDCGLGYLRSSAPSTCAAWLRRRNDPRAP